MDKVQRSFSSNFCRRFRAFF